MIQSFNHSELATVVLVQFILFVVSYIGIVVIIDRLTQSLKNKSSAIKVLHELVNKTNEVQSDSLKVVENAMSSMNKRLQELERELYKPLYQIGNYIEYTRFSPSGITSESGRIVDVLERTDAEPGYIVDGTEGNGSEINQSDITAWSE